MCKIPDDMKPGTVHDSNNCGTMTIVSYKKQAEVKVVFNITGTTLIVNSSDLRAGKVKDKNHPSVEGVGFVGYGDHNPGGLKNRNPAYVCWHSMISRCYSTKRQLRTPCYAGVSVCKEWLNFQKFANWYYDNYPSDGKIYHLDKDLKINGNKVYSPETCLFVTAEENCNETNVKDYKFKNPLGELVTVRNLSAFCRGNNLVGTNMSAVHSGKRKQHKGWTKY